MFSHTISFAIFCAHISSLLNVWALQTVASSEILDKEPLPISVDTDVYSALQIYAHLIDISYCISPISQIHQPFSCGLDCASAFPNLTLIHQWYNDDADSGYIATTCVNLLHPKNSFLQPKKTIIVSLRGTRSFEDTLADVDAEQVLYLNSGRCVRKCGSNCRVHRGFYKYFVNTLDQISTALRKELDTPDYELLIMGHSLGGAIAVFLGLYYIDLGYDSTKVVTMGQPLIGNEAFTEFVDSIMGSRGKASLSATNRKYWRVVRKRDIVTVIPAPLGDFAQYAQFENQLYLNSTVKPCPPLSHVVDCITGENTFCIKGDYPMLWTGNSADSLFQTHMLYFRSMGQCKLI